VPPTAQGATLLVGRDNELRTLKLLLESTSLHPTIEGANGVGKTSLVGVAAYQLFQVYRRGGSQQAFIPLARPFQLQPEDTVDGFRRRVLFEIAQGLIDHWDDLKGGGLSIPDVTEIRRWLTRATTKGGGVGATVAGFGGSLAGNITPNTSAGFNESGFGTVIESWMRQVFPSQESGAFIAVIDNLELLETSQTARRLLESMRDEVLGLPGVRWVLCGSRGIVQTIASSSRLEGRLGSPMVLGPLTDNVVADVVRARRDAFKLGSSAVAPLSPRAFTSLYEVLNRNLRNALKYADDFAIWLALNSEPPWVLETNDALFSVWLTETADEHHQQTKLGKAAWKAFDTLIELGGTCSPSDYEAFGYDTPMALRPQFKALEDTNLVTSAIDKDDRRRKTITVSPRGWMVQYARSGYFLPKHYLP
jgi:hypothetical protein